MMHRILTLLLALACGARVLVASPGPPLHPGERLRYSVSWAVVPGAGEITVAAVPSPPGQTKIVTTTSTRRLARLLMPFDAVANAVYDANTGALLSLHEHSQKRGKHVERLVTFNYDSHTANYVPIGSGEPKTLEMPEGLPSDLITALLDTRTWDIKPGEKRDSLVIFDDDFYELTIHALRYENVDTPLGKFRTLVLEPRMEKTPPKGMFKKGSTVQVWIAQDARRLPVKFEVEFNIGTGTATLTSYTPPAVPTEVPQPVPQQSRTAPGQAR